MAVVPKAKQTGISVKAKQARAVNAAKAIGARQAEIRAANNIFAGKTRQLRLAMMSAVEPEDVIAIMMVLVEKAKKGDMEAIKEVLLRGVGKPQEADLHDQLIMMEQQLAQVIAERNGEQALLPAPDSDDVAEPSEEQIAQAEADLMRGAIKQLEHLVEINNGPNGEQQGVVEPDTTELEQVEQLPDSQFPCDPTEESPDTE